MRLEISFGVPNNQRVKVARIFYEAFETEFKNVFGPKERGIPIISRHLRDDRTVVAISRGVVVGFAGLEFKGKGFIDMSFWQLVRELGFGILRVIFLGCCFVVFRQIWMFLNKSREKEILFDAMAVAGNMRGKGIGSSLLNFVIDFGCSRGYTQIRFSVYDKNVRARRLFERVGFKEARVRKIVFPWNRILSFNAASEMIYKIQIASRRDVN